MLVEVPDHEQVIRWIQMVMEEPVKMEVRYLGFGLILLRLKEFDQNNDCGHSEFPDLQRILFSLRELYRFPYMFLTPCPEK